MSIDLTRRNVLKAGGLIVAGGALGGCATATGINPAIPPAAKVLQDSSQVRTTSAAAGASMPLDGQPEDKPTYVPEGPDPVSFSRADNLFWNDIMMEHAMFFQMLLPATDKSLDTWRQQAQDFQRQFQQQLQQSAGLRADNYVAFNQRSIDMAKRFSDWKKNLREQTLSAKVRTLIWPLFLEHTAREADRFAMRLAQYNRRDTGFDRNEVVQFWSLTMGEHSGFIAHLLDPKERLLIDQARNLEEAFLERGMKDVRGDAIAKAAKEVLDFKTVGEKGIKAGKIKSIIHPSLASHVRREAVKFNDELRRTEA